MDVDSLVVEGYVVCRCGRWLTAAEAEVSDRCPACLEAMKRDIDEGVTVVVEGEEVALPAYAARKPKRAHSPNRDPERARLDRMARRRAQQRLAEIHAPMYALLLEQEKAKLGLFPKNKRTRPPLRLVTEDHAEAMRDYVERAHRTSTAI